MRISDWSSDVCSSDLPDRAALVEDARVAIARGSKSFAMASRLFDTETRERAWLLYAWCRRCDDIIDGQELGHGLQAVADPAARLAENTRLTAAALRGAVTRDPPFDRLGIVAGRQGRGLGKKVVDRR